MAKEKGSSKFEEIKCTKIYFVLNAKKNVFHLM